MVIVSSFPSDTTGISGVYVSNALEIVPNPFNTSAKISVHGFDATLQLEVYNLMGELVRVEQYNTNTFVFESKHLAQGTYFIKVSSKDGKYAYTKMVIN